MCQWGNSILLLVPIPPDLSYTGRARWAVKPIDACIAPIIQALNDAGILTAASCCGHGKADGEIWLQDGRKLIVVNGAAVNETVSIGKGMNEHGISEIGDIQRLVVEGCTDWKQYGEVVVRPFGDLLIFNYTQAAQYAHRWNLFEQVSRGLIINARTGEVVARPFDKFFNWFEGGRKADGHIVTITEKMDGSLGILYRDGGRYAIATRGSFDSDQALWATRFLNEYYDLRGLPDEWTLLLEIVYPQNRVVVDYQGAEELVLLAIRNRSTGEYLPFFPTVFETAEAFGFSIPRTYQFNNVTDIMAAAAVLDEKTEGWVVEFSDGQRFKFKGDKYLELHRLIFGLSFKNTLAAVASGTVAYVREQIPDEFLGQFNAWVEEIEATVRTIQVEVAAALDAAPKDSRKEFALWVRANHLPLAPYLFAALDGKPVEPMIYRQAFENRVQASEARRNERGRVIDEIV